MSDKIVLEFYGIPGTGKTTISNEVKNILDRERGIKTCLFSEYYNFTKKNKKSFIKNYLSLGIRKQYILINLVTKILWRKKFNKESVKNAFNLINHFSTLHFCYKFENYDFIIQDQGLIQNLVSINFDEKFRTELQTSLYSINLLYENFSNYFLIDAVDSVESSISRVDKRLNGTSRIDNMENSMKKNILSIQEKNFKFLSLLISKNIQRIDTAKSIDYNARIIGNQCILQRKNMG